MGDDASVLLDARRGFDLVHGREEAAVAVFAQGNAAARFVRAREFDDRVRAEPLM